MKSKHQVEDKIEKQKKNIMKLDFYSFFEMVSQDNANLDLNDERMMEIFNKYYDRCRVEIYKDRTNFRTQLMKARIKDMKMFYKKHQVFGVRKFILYFSCSKLRPRNL